MVTKRDIPKAIGRPPKSGMPSRPLTSAERKRLLLVANEGARATRNVALIQLGFGSGMRIGELVSLKIADVMSANGKVRDQIVLGMTKNGKSHRVYLTKQGLKALETYLSSLPERYKNPECPLFRSQKSGFLSPSSGSRLIVGLLKKAGIEKVGGSHSIRKSLASELYKHCGNLKVVSKVLNHSSLAVTSRYIGVTSEEISTAVAGLKL